ncbi:hypothetical protein BD413DRAFT_524681 [Trametes elegans]|nr:hypothetical protein BD413DRAFT_524681 [Trametes elegans]
MAPNPKTAEIIDLTDSPAARVIELNSDGEVVPGASADTAQAQPEQTKRKRKKRKRKSTNGGASAGASEREEGEIGTGTSGADVSRNSPNVDDIELHIEMLADRDGGGGGGGEEVVPAEGSGRKKTLAERLDRKRGREGDREREKDRQRDRDRERRRDEDRDRQRERRRSRSRERGGDRSRRRSREREREQRRRDKAPVADAPLFFEDVTPAELPPAVKPQENIAGPSKPRQSEASAGALPEKTEPDLLLPAHVSLAEGAEGDADSGALKVPTPEGSDDEDYIDYLDYDDDRRAPGMVRYWELEKLAASEAKATKPSRTVCKKCGAEGEHKTYECPVLICLTCGARDEHLTRSCPISKTCFTCGMKGHIGKTCPNRAATRAGEYNQYHDCDRCGARTHQTNECPTLWRIYDYVGDDERQEILRVRETKRTLGLGQGGEGYIATDEWCYNCGGCGHLGDVRPLRPALSSPVADPQTHRAGLQ